jgi:hypothetical protein
MQGDRYIMASGTWTQQKKLNDHFGTKGVKATHGLGINKTELLELKFDDLDLELGPAPNYNLN